MEFFHEPGCFAAICVNGDGDTNVARVLEGPAPDWKYFGHAGTGNGSAGASYGFPRFRQAGFLARFPFATVELRDDLVPLDVTLVAWSPFTPGDSDSSSLPVGSLEYTFRNTSAKPIDAVFSFNTRNFMQPERETHFIDQRDYGVAAFPNGFLLWSDDSPGNAGSFAVFVDSDDVVVDHCWFRGGWWDAPTLAWRNIQRGVLLDNPPRESGAPGASLFVPIRLAPGEARTIRLMTAWYAGNTNFRVGMDNRTSAVGEATGQDISGNLGERLLDSGAPHGDGQTGGLVSRPFEIEEEYVHLLIAGGSLERKTVVQLVVDHEIQHVAAGKNSDRLEWWSWNVGDLRGKTAQIRILDFSVEPGGHICVDSIVFSDQAIDALTEGDGNELKSLQHVRVFEDFESPAAEQFFGSVAAEVDPEEPFYRPWYTAHFENVGDVAAHWKRSYGDLRSRSVTYAAGRRPSLVLGGLP